MPPIQYTLINYKELISDLTDSYFSRCVNLLYPVLGFEYLAESDVRRIDLCEKIATLPWRCSMSPRNVKIGAVQDYISALEFYMDNYLICKKGCIAEAYHAHAKQLAAELKAAPTVQGTESLFAIYLGLARELYQSGAMRLIDSLLIKLER